MLGRIAPSRGHPESLSLGGSHRSRGPLSFTLLGSLAVHDRDGQAIAIPGTKARALLALLLVRANGRVPTDQLEDELLDGAPPRGVRSTVQAHVSRLRGVLEATGSAAMLAGAPAATKYPSIRPRSTCIASRRWLGAAPRCSRTILVTRRTCSRRALDEWRGPALQDVRHVPHLQLEAIRLDELRLATIEARLAAELATGGHVMAVSALQRLVEEHPYREHLRALLMLALYRSGRQVEALRTYQGARVALGRGRCGTRSRAPRARRMDQLRRSATRVPRRFRYGSVPKNVGASWSSKARTPKRWSRPRPAPAVECCVRGPRRSTPARIKRWPMRSSPLLDNAVEPELAPIVGSPASTAGVDLAYQRFRAFEAVAELLRTPCGRGSRSC